MKLLLSLLTAGILITPFFVSEAAAQTDDMVKAEAFIGYMHKRNGDEGFNGVNLAGVYNISRWAGVKVDYSYSRGPDYPTLGPQTERTFMAGLQIKNNLREVHKVRPFAHVLVGASRQTMFGPKTNALTYAIGGGADLRVSERLAVRIIQADYQPTFHNAATFAQLRLSFGVIFN